LCKVCENEYAYHGGTSNLRDHLVCAHPSKLRPPEDLPCLYVYLSKAKCSESRAKKITEHIVGIVLRDLCPAAMVEGVGFQALMNYLDIMCHLLHTLLKWLGGSLPMKKLLSKVTFKQFFAFIWTSRANDAYLSLTCYFTNSRWNMVTCVLATTLFPEHHMANNIAEKVQQVMAEYGLEKNCLLSVVHDQC